MTINDGTKLGRYEIRSKLGVGGMGEVFLAHDAMLDRKVALKILPADLATNLLDYVSFSTVRQDVLLLLGQTILRYAMEDRIKQTLVDHGWTPECSIRCLRSYNRKKV